MDLPHDLYIDTESLLPDVDEALRLLSQELEQPACNTYNSAVSALSLKSDDNAGQHHSSTALSSSNKSTTDAGYSKIVFDHHNLTPNQEFTLNDYMKHLDILLSRIEKDQSIAVHDAECKPSSESPP